MIDIVIPILNEEKRVDELVSRLKNICPGARLIFVDNASVDNTVQKLQEYDVHIIRHSKNEGYGKSLYDGIQEGSNNIIVTIDADLEYPPEDIPKLLEKLEQYPIVYGSRFLEYSPETMGIARGAGNKLLTKFFNLLYGVKLTDLYTGIKAFRRSAFDGVGFRLSGFPFVIEFAAYATRMGATIGEVQVDYRARSFGKSKMKHVQETFKAIFWLIVMLFLPIPKINDVAVSHNLKKS